jgi:hypothetical protein
MVAGKAPDVLNRMAGNAAISSCKEWQISHVAIGMWKMQK